MYCKFANRLLDFIYTFIIYLYSILLYSFFLYHFTLLIFKYYFCYVFKPSIYIFSFFTCNCSCSYFSIFFLCLINLLYTSKHNFYLLCVHHFLIYFSSSLLLLLQFISYELKNNLRPLIMKLLKRIKDKIQG